MFGFAFLEPFLTRLIPYKDLFIVLGILIAIGSIFGAGYHLKSVIDHNDDMTAAHAAVTTYVSLTDKTEKQNALQLGVDLDAIIKDQSGNGDVAPVLHHALDRLRVRSR